MNKKGILSSLLDKAFPVINSGNDTSVSKESSVSVAERPPVAQSPAQPVPSGDVKGVVKQEILDKLFESLNASDQPGIDFLEFYKAIKKSGSIRTPDVIRNGYNMLSGIDSSVSKKKLLDTASVYLSVLDRERNDFDGGFPDLIHQTIGENTSKIDANNKEIENLKSQLTTINSRLMEINEINAALNDEVAQKRIKLDRLKADFEATSSSVKEDLEDVVGLIKAYVEEDIAQEEKSSQ